MPSFQDEGGGRVQVDASIVINRPVEAVWAYTTDFANATVINPAAREQRLTSEGPPRKGSTYVWIGELWGRRFESLIARTVRRNLDTGLANAKAALEAQG
jgi:hypothetical protein